MPHVKGKDKNEILAELMESGVPGSINLEQQKMGIVVRSVENIEGSLKSLEVSMKESGAGKRCLVLLRGCVRLCGCIQMDEELK